MKVLQRARFLVNEMGIIEDLGMDNDEDLAVVPQQDQETQPSTSNNAPNNSSTIEAENKGQASGISSRAFADAELLMFFQENAEEMTTSFSDVEPEEEYFVPENNRLSVEPLTQNIGNIFSGASGSRKRSESWDNEIPETQNDIRQPDQRKKLKKTDTIELDQNRYQDPKPPPPGF